MFIVDSHVHAGAGWSEPVEVVLFQMESNGVAHAVLVQHNGCYDNTYLFDCCRHYPHRFRFVGGLDLQDPERIRNLEALHRQGAAGFRVNLRKENEWHPDNPAFAAAGDLGMIVSVIGDAENFASARFKTLLDNCPDTHFCLEHLARSPGLDAAAPPYDIYRSALECSQWPNTTIKVPGWGEILKRPPRLPGAYPFDAPPPHYEMAYQAFGAERMMWGSNFPPCAAKEGYRNTLQAVLGLQFLQQGDGLDWVMGWTAARLWGFQS